jgi:imidazole glycerol-phosphate synthase subunit HisH
MIGIVDYSTCNIRAIENLLTYNNIPNEVISEVPQRNRYSAYILPGNGHFDSCVKSLHSSGFGEFLTDEVINRGKPILGICVGAQLMGVSSEEGQEPGLNWLDFHCRKFPKKLGLPVPNIGWRDLNKTQSVDVFFKEMGSKRFYFMHSFYIPDNIPDVVSVTSTYGVNYSAAFKRGNIFGVQFHPEKSHKYGAWLIKQFFDLVKAQ